jgi:long-chain fatty acid transport protein
LRAHRHIVIPGIGCTGTLIAEYLTRRRLWWVAAALLASAGSAQATNGLLIPGYGIKAFGMGGVSIALPQDSVTAANNPAGVALIGSRWDIGSDFAFAKAGARVFGSDLEDSPFIVIPEAGYSKIVKDGLAVGVSLFGSGLHVDYGQPVLVPTNSKSSVDLKQVVAAPTVAAMLGQNQALGASLSLARQRFSVTGLEFPSGVQNPGHDYSNGVGFRLGWIGQLASSLSAGVMYASKIRMGKLDQYQGVLADGGRLDIPEQYGVGVAIKATDQLMVAADYLRINWHDITSLGNAVNLAAPLGASDGSGLGWKNQDVFRVGASYAFSERLDLRAGYSHASQLIPSDQTFLDFLAPLTTREHLSVGTTWKFSGSSELTLAYMHSFKEDIQGTGLSTGVDVHDRINWLAIGYGYRF